MGLELVPAGKALPDDIYVVIEIPANSDPIKYEVDKETGHYSLIVLWQRQCFIQQTMVM